MSSRPANTTHDEAWPRLWRLLVVGLCALILCSCQAPRTPPALSGDSAGLPPEAFTGAPPQVQPCAANEIVKTDGVPTDGRVVDPGFKASGLIVPVPVRSPWSPPGIEQPWPKDEYLLDGGDRDLPAGVTKDSEVHGLEPEDTVAHFDTVDGKTVVTPSNQVRIYSPRFGAVRKVVSVTQDEQWDHLAGMQLATRLIDCEDRDTPIQSKQNLQVNRDVGTKMASTFRSGLLKGVMSSAVGPKSFQNAFLAYENLQVIRTGQFVESEMAFLAQGVDAAVSWDHKQAVQIILDHKGAMAVNGDDKVESVFTVKSPPGNPKLRLIKVASTQFAEPGDTVDFTLRFDNVGNQPIGDVTILDNLTTRLEYVPGSAQCSLPARFATQPNEAESLALRWEINDPVPPNKGGIIRFRCTVR